MDNLVAFAEMLDKEAPECINNVPQVGASTVLVMKQESQKLMTLAQAAAHNQQELSTAVQRSLEASVYNSIAVDKSQLLGVSPHQCQLYTLVSGSNSNPPPILGTPSQEVPDDRLSRASARPKDSTCLDFCIQMVKVVGSAN